MTVINLYCFSSFGILGLGPYQALAKAIILIKRDLFVDGHLCCGVSSIHFGRECRFLMSLETQRVRLPVFLGVNETYGPSIAA